MRKEQLLPRRPRSGTAAFIPARPPLGRPRALPNGTVPLSPALRSTRSRARADAAARRRLVMTVLVVALVVPTLVGLATGLTAAWWVAVAVLPLVCIYGAVVMRARRLMAEREFNVAFLGGTNLTKAGLEDIFAARPGPGGVDLRELERPRVVAR